MCLECGPLPPLPPRRVLPLVLVPLLVPSLVLGPLLVRVLLFLRPLVCRCHCHQLQRPRRRFHRLLLLLLLLCRWCCRLLPQTRTSCWLWSS